MLFLFEGRLTAVQGFCTRIGASKGLLVVVVLEKLRASIICRGDCDVEKGVRLLLQAAVYGSRLQFTKACSFFFLLLFILVLPCLLVGVPSHARQ